MMDDVLRRGAEVARLAQEKRLQDIAQHLRAMVGSAAVETQSQQVRVNGRGLARQWLTDTRLRFLAGGLK